MSFIISCNNNKKIEVDINNKNVQKSKLFVEFYEEYKGGVLYTPFDVDLVNCFIDSGFKFDDIKFEKVYNFLNYLIVDNEVMIEYIFYKLYKIDYEDIKYYIENVIDKSFLKLLLEQKGGILTCARNNDIVGVFIWINYGADVNMHNVLGCTALHYASENGNIEIVKLILESGTDVNSKDIWGCTALHDASRNCYVEVVRVLLESGADINVKDNNGQDALQCASKNGYFEVVKVLLESGADINMHNVLGITALDLASLNGHTEIVKLLKQYT